MTHGLQPTRLLCPWDFPGKSTQLCPTLCDPMECRRPGLPVHHQLLEFTQLMSVELVMPSNHLILCCLLLSCLQSFPASGSLSMSQFFTSGGQCIGISASTSVHCSCLENPRDGGAWWAAVYGVAHSRTRLKRLSSSSSTVVKFIETENTVVVAKGWEKRNGKLVFSGYWRTWKSSGGGWW